MDVLFEGTFAELQQQIPTLTLPLEKQVFLVDSADVVGNGAFHQGPPKSIV